MLSHTASVHVAGTTRRPFKYCATFVWDEPATRPSPPPMVYLYAEGDLAAFLEDCGGNLSEIAALLDSLEAAPDANISVTPRDGLSSAYPKRQS
jgi:hypothetical protein